MGHVVMTSELAGVPENEVLEIETKERGDPMRKAVYAFARKVTLRPAETTRADVDALRPWFTDRQIVELVFFICRYNTMNRLADAFGAPLEKENVFRPRGPAVKSAAAPPAPPGRSPRTPS